MEADQSLQKKSSTSHSITLREEENTKKANKRHKYNKCSHSNQPFKIQSMGNNISLISRDFANTFISNTHISKSSNDVAIDDCNFPLLGSQAKHLKKATNYTKYKSVTNNEKLFSLQDFVKTTPTATSSEFKKKIKPVTNIKYAGNLLDSSLPIRKSGKFRETPKPKRLSKLKQEIIQEQSECEQTSEEKTIYVFGTYTILDDDIVSNFISRVVDLQEKLFKRDCIKGKSKRRYVVGLHETKKYLTLKKVKVLIISTDIKCTKEDGALQIAVKELIDLCKQNSIYYFFALKRRKLGVLTLKYIPISCIAILNYEGAEGHFNEIRKLIMMNDNEDINEQILEDTNVNVIEVFQSKGLELPKNE